MALPLERPPRRGRQPYLPPLRVVPPAERAPGWSTAPEGRWLVVGSRGRMWVREEPGPKGAGAVVMLHGLGATGGLNWAGAQTVLGDRFRMLTVDLRGHGRGIRTRRFSLEDCADDAAAMIDALGLVKPIVVGYSMGGPVACLLWRRHRSLVGGLVLCATSRNFRGSPGEKLGFGALALAGLSPLALPLGALGGWTAVVRHLPLPTPGPAADLRFVIEELAGHDPRSIVQAAGAVGAFNASPWIGDIDVPTSVVVTMADQLVPPIRQVRLARSIPDATIHRIDAGHLCIAGGLQKSLFLSALRQACLDVEARI